MKLKRFICAIAFIMTVITLAVSCTPASDLITTAPDTTTAPTTNPAEPSFVDPKYPLMDLFSADLSEYLTLGKVMTLAINHSVYVGDEDLDEALEALAKENKYFLPAEPRLTQKGDVLQINFLGKIDGVAFNGGTAEGKFISLSENTGYIPGFDADLYGIMPGTTVSTKVTFPENYHSNDLAGKEAVFDITVTAIVGEYGFTDETVDKFTSGQYKTLAEFREAYRESLIKKKLESFETDSYFAVVDALQKNATVKMLPEAHAKAYYYIILNDHKNYFNQYAYAFAMYYGINTFEQYKAAYGLTDSYLTDNAKLSVMEDLVLVAAAKQLGVEYTDAEYDAFFEELAEEWYFESAEKLVDFYTEEYLKLHILKEKCVEYIIENCNFSSDYDEYKHLLESKTE